MHPYRVQASRAFWSKSVTQNFDSDDLVSTDEPLISQEDRVVSAGSCFASNIVPYLEKSGITYVRTEQPIPGLNGFDVEDFGYHKFSAGYGNIYTPRQLLQLILRAKGKFHPEEDRWHIGSEVIDPYRPGLKFNASSDEEFDALQKQHFSRTITAFEKADVFVFTLGLTEAWISKADGAVFPACPGTMKGIFDPAKHEFKNFTVAELVKDLESVVVEIRELNPAVRFILTVSPVPLVATATPQHVLLASTYSKSALRVAAQEITLRYTDVSYFPAYEIVTGPQAPKNFFGEDRRNVTEPAVAEVMRALLSHCDVPLPGQAGTRPVQESLGESLSAIVIRAECEEGAMDRAGD